MIKCLNFLFPRHLTERRNPIKWPARSLLFTTIMIAYLYFCIEKKNLINKLSFFSYFDNFAKFRTFECDTNPKEMRSQ